jgi:hypothetical protein
LKPQVLQQVGLHEQNDGQQDNSQQKKADESKHVEIPEYTNLQHFITGEIALCMR